MLSTVIDKMYTTVNQSLVGTEYATVNGSGGGIMRNKFHLSTICRNI